MIKTLLLGGALLGMSCFANAQLFQNFIGKSIPVERGNSVAIGMDSSFVLAGNYKNTSSATVSVAAMTRLTKTGTLQWVKQFNINNSGTASATAVYNDAIRTASGKANGHITLVNKGANMYVIRTNTAGTVLWTRKISGGTPKGVCIKAQYASPTGSLEAFYVAFRLGNSGTGSVLLRLDPNGITVWQRNVKPADNITNINFNDLQVTADKGCIVTGDRTDIFVGEPILLKFTNAGAITFAKEYFFDFFRFSKGHSVTVTPTGYAVGGSKDQSSTIANTNLVFSVNTAGTVIWANEYSSASVSLMRTDNIVSDAAGNIIFGGNAFNTGIPAYLVKLNAAGTVLFGKTYYSALAGNDLKLSPQGYCLTGTADFNTANEDFYIINTNTSGTVATGCNGTNITVSKTLNDTSVFALNFVLTTNANVNDTASSAAPSITTEQSRCGTLSPDVAGATEMQSFKLMLYPGSTNSIRLQFVMEETGNAGNLMAAVYDINGLLITTGVIKPNQLQTLYSNRLGQGIYTVVITANGTRVANEKIILGH